MMMLVWTVFRNSLPLQLATLALAAWAWLGINNHVQRKKGAAAVTVEIAKKADDNAKLAETVRDEVAAAPVAPAVPDAKRVRGKYERAGD